MAHLPPPAASEIEAPSGTGTGRHDPTAEPTDLELLRAHLAGSSDAFAALVRRHRHRMWALALRTMGNPEEAADALQDAYLSAFRGAGGFRGEAQVTTWLHRVVLNACLDRLRHNQRRVTRPLPDDLDHRPQHRHEPQHDPVEMQQRRRTVAAALSQLSADQRAALVLIDMEGYSVTEAAALLGCAPGTVKSRCFRGRARLVPLLADLWESVSRRDRVASGR